MYYVPFSKYPRRRILKAGSLTLIGLAGCISDAAPTESTGSGGNGTTTSPSTTTTHSGNSPAEVETSIASLSVLDYVVYPLAGAHPHVHRQANTQYVVVRVQATAEERTLQNRLSLTLDSESMPFAEQQPVSWRNETVDIAFAIPKSQTYDRGRLLIDGEAVHSLSTATLDRLNNPPVFEVSNVTVSPEELRARENTEAMVQFYVRNTGAGTGEFAASLSGNYVSGSNTVTGRVEIGERRRFEARTTVVGNGDAATARLDWGTDQWTGSIPVVNEQN